MNALSYIGASFGASIVTPLLALEERFTSAVLFIGGFSSANVLTLSDQLTHVAQITLPTLMVNGTSDNIFPQVTSAIPFYEKLGTPQDSKKIIFFDGGHEAPPRAMLVRETVSNTENLPQHLYIPSTPSGLLHTPQSLAEALYATLKPQRHQTTPLNEGLGKLSVYVKAVL